MTNCTELINRKSINFKTLFTIVAEQTSQLKIFFFGNSPQQKEKQQIFCWNHLCLSLSMSFVQADFPFQYDKCACIYIVPVRIRKNDENSLGIQQFHWNSSSNFYAVSATVSPFKVSLTFSLSQSLFLSLSSLFYKHTNTTNMLDLRSRFSIVCKQFSYIFSN